MWGRDTPALFLYLDGHSEDGTVELDAFGQAPSAAEHRGRAFRLDRVGRAGYVVYVERSGSGVSRTRPSSSQPRTVRW